MHWLNIWLLHIFVHILLPFYPIAYATRNWNFRLFSWLLDDGRFNSTGLGFAKDYKVWLENNNYKKETWMAAFKWHMGRNRLFNFFNKFKVYNGDPLMGNQSIIVIEFVIDNLYKNNEDQTHMQQDTEWVISAGLKYIGKPDQDPWQINQGEIISIRTSVLGTGFIWYQVKYKDKNGKIKFAYYFRYSQCKIIKYPLIGSYYRTLRAGTNSARHTLTMKHQKIKEWM